MSQCPKCQEQIEIDSQFFGGLFTCPKCSNPFFVGFDGAPERAEIQEPPSFIPAQEIVMPVEAPMNFEAPMKDPIQDIVDFGNQEVPTAPLFFNLKIGGLDLAKNVDELMEALSDSKFGFKIEELKKKIRHGELRIEKLDPAKAAVIAQRLRPFDLKMDWEQKIYE